MDEQVRIVRQDEDIEFAEGGTLIKHVRIQFKVGTDGPFTRRFPQEGFSAIAARLALEEFARELRALRGGA